MADTGLIAFLALIAAPATSSGLIVILPLVGAVVGGIVGAWANSWYRDKEARKLREQEREGLLRLIHAEIRSNDDVLESGKTYRDIASNLRTDVWDESKIKLAQLLPSDHIDLLNRYYNAVHIMRRNFALYTVEMSENIKKQIRDVRAIGDRTIANAEQFMSDAKNLGPLQPRNRQRDGTAG
jgi:hypothetical protein